MSPMLKRILFRILILLSLVGILVAPAFADQANGKIVVVIDAGHGGRDGGTVTGTLPEKEYNLKIASYLAEALAADERFDVRMTRDDDVYLTYLERALVARDANADLLLSVHCNSYPLASVSGLAAYYSVVERFSAEDLAGQVLDAVSAAVPIARGKAESREDTGDSLGIYYWNAERQWDMPGASSLGIRSDYYSMNTWASKFGIPSLIVEHGYLSNPGDLAVLDSDASLRKIAQAEADAIINYYTGHVHVYAASQPDFPSNCVLTGTASERCTVCGAKRNTTLLAPAPDAHYWRTADSRAATCTENGYVHRICQISYNLNAKGYDCGVHEVTETIPATGHSYVVVEDIPASHGKDGRLVRRCEACGDVVEEIRPGEPHNYVVTADTQPTCIEDGLYSARCSICGALVEEVRPAAGHRFEEVERVPATPEEEGHVRWVCAVCGEEKVEAIQVCPHEFAVTASAEPTCTEDGFVTETCSLCGYEKTEILPALGHDYETQMQAAPGCETEGFYRGKCTRCGDVVTERLAPLGHLFVEGEDGVRVCSVCGASETPPAEEEERSLGTFLSSPVVLILIGVILLQFVIVVVLIVRNRARKPEAETEENKE